MNRAIGPVYSSTFIPSRINSLCMFRGVVEDDNTKDEPPGIVDVK